MNRFKVRAFGITRELLGGKDAFIDIRGRTVGDLRSELNERYPELLGLKSLFIAVNNDYADDDRVLEPTDEIALIPPVSGG
jgi:sulfur-carrier protein